MSWTRLGQLACGFSFLLASAAPDLRAQGLPTRTPDSLRYRLLQCGSYDLVVRQQKSNAAVRTALTNVASCPEGPQVLAGLWRDAVGDDASFMSSLATLSSPADSVVVGAVLSTLADGKRPESVRLRALGVFLQHLTGEFDSQINFEPVALLPFMTRDSTGKVIEIPTDSVHWTTRFINRPDGIVLVSPELHARIVNTIAALADDASSTARLRLAARAVNRTIQNPRYRR